MINLIFLIVTNKYINIFNSLIMITNLPSGKKEKTSKSKLSDELESASEVMNSPSTAGM